MIGGVLCARTPKPWILSSSSPPYRRRRFPRSAGFLEDLPRGAVSVWRAGAPAAIGDWRQDFLIPAAADANPRLSGEGSWNVAWDARPARWTHRLDLACLLFGVCAILARSQFPASVSGGESNDAGDKSSDDDSVNYRVTGVVADGRCLFRAIAHGACLQSGEEAPDELRQRELADELRAQVVNELLRRREEIEWFIEGDFDAYVKQIQKPFVWAGEPELLMASHVLKTPIAVYVSGKNLRNLTDIATYGEEYQKDKISFINVLFHGYGHYELLETSSNPM